LLFKQVNRKADRQKRRLRVRKKVAGTPERPRLSIYRSLNHIYAQIIDDTKGLTLVSASTMEPDVKGRVETGGDAGAAQAVGKVIAQKAVEKGIRQVVFDRGGNIYHGRIRALADAAREAGLDF